MPVRVFHVGRAETALARLCLSHRSEAHDCMASPSFVHRAVCSSDPEHTDVERRRLSKPELPSLCHKKTHFPTILALSVNMLKAGPILPPRSEAQKESTAPFFRRQEKKGMWEVRAESGLNRHCRGHLILKSASHSFNGAEPSFPLLQMWIMHITHLTVVSH